MGQFEYRPYAITEPRVVKRRIAIALTAGAISVGSIAAGIIGSRSENQDFQLGQVAPWSGMLLDCTLPDIPAVITGDVICLGPAPATSEPPAPTLPD